MVCVEKYFYWWDEIMMWYDCWFEMVLLIIDYLVCLFCVLWVIGVLVFVFSNFGI